MATLTKKQILEQVGDPKQVAGELRSFRQAARTFSSNRPRLIDKYRKQWVGVYRGRVRAHGRSAQSVIAELDKKGLPRQQVLLRFIDDRQRTMIL